MNWKKLLLCSLLVSVGLRFLSAMAAAQIITTVAGNGSAGYNGDNIPATSASIYTASGVAEDHAGNIFISDQYNQRIRRVDAASGLITTVAGNGIAGETGDGGPATSASISSPYAVALDNSGNLFIADYTGLVVRRVDAVTGIISTIAGMPNGPCAYGGDNGPAINANFCRPQGLAVDKNGNIFIADIYNNRVRRVDSTTGIITTVAGDGTCTSGGDGGLATSASVCNATGVALDLAGNMYITEGASRVRRVDAVSGIITTVAGNGVSGFSGDNGPATNANLWLPNGVTVDAAGNFFIADFYNNRIRRVDAATGIISTVAGNGTQGYNGDNIPATSASLYYPIAVALDPAGNPLIMDMLNQRVRKVTFSQKPAGRPIVFAPGICEHSSDWATFQSKLYPRLQSLPGNLYPNSDTYDALYDPLIDSVKFYLNGTAVNENAIPTSARFFRIEFYEPSYDPNTGNVDTTNVMKISVLNKAYELSRVIKRIGGIAGTKDVILVAHSLGGLVSRAYLENMASQGLCYSDGNPIPTYNNGLCSPGASDAAFAHDVADLITIDTPHAGTPLASFKSELLQLIGQHCIGDPSVNRNELYLRSLGGAGLVESLNFDGSALAGKKPAPNVTRIQAVEDYFSDVTDPWGGLDNGFLKGGFSDDIVLLPEQSIKANILPKYSKSPIQDVPTTYLSTDAGINSTSACWVGLSPFQHLMLHDIHCLGAQDYTQGNVFSQLSSYAFDQPVDTAFASTAQATPITSSGTTLNGTVNPKGSPGYAYFLWGSDPTMTTAAKTTPQPVAANSKAQAFPAPIGGLASGTTFFFQMVYLNSTTGGYQNGAILVLKTVVPVLTTTPASQITNTGATLYGKINPKGSPGNAYFVWGTDPNLIVGTQTTAFQAVTPDSNIQMFKSPITSLTGGTKYYFKIGYWNTANSSFQYGVIHSFKTLG